MLEFHYPIEVHIYKTGLFSHHEFLHFIRMYSTTDLRTRKLLMRQKRGLFFAECVKKDTSSLPANVNTSVAKRKTRRGPGPRGTRVGSICSRTAAPGRRLQASLASPDSLLAVVRPWNSLFLSLSLSLPLSGHPRDADALVLPRRSATMNRPTRRTTLVHSSPPRGCCGYPVLSLTCRFYVLRTIGLELVSC